MAHSKAHWRNGHNSKKRARMLMTEDPKVYVLVFGPYDTITVSSDSEKTSFATSGSATLCK